MPSTSKVHPVFHVAQLKGVIADLPIEKELSPKWEDDVVLMTKAEAILSSCEVPRHGEDIEEWLIH